MRTFSYVGAPDVAGAVRAIAEEPNAKFLGGDTNLVDLMRERIEQPDTVVDISGLPLDEVEELPGGGVRIGATVKNSRLAADPLIRRRYPMLSQAILKGASAQLRNMATVGGNLVQRTKCPYFYDSAAACNKREPGAGCDAIGGFHRAHGILGVSQDCIATHPSDMCVALSAPDATVEVESVRGTRRIPLPEFHQLPGSTPHIETTLAADELITAVELPEAPVAVHSRYRKVRDRSSYAFALVSAAVALEVTGGKVTDVRLALGGVSAKPWRAHAAERALLGAPATEDSFRLAAETELEPATGLPGNAFKITLAQRTIVATLRDLLTDGSVA
ncbi:FAD binding domain-containing protein [Streptomyces sp. NPDC056835]|uniref:FAD binding domain-containing protein n=1 Tax=Streptomyces sp. NPDC056835 TaxID=3345956 RepID=UPI0036AC58ED